jgi:hypothetical protein
MREIKFRAWFQHPEYCPKGEMFNVASIFFAKKETGEPEYYLQPEPIEIGLMEGIYDKIGYNEYKYCKLLQDTGLKDKNGVEICDGYIVKTNTGNIVSVEYDNYYGAYLFGGFGTTQDEIYELEIEIIGNIYENPELLDKK